MNNSQYKKYHESFMQNNMGSSAIHTCLYIYFTIQCTLFCAIKQKKGDYDSYISEYLIIVFPMILSHTFLSDYIYELNLIIFLLLLFEIVKNWKNFNFQKTLSSNNIFTNNKIQTITCLRGLTYLITILCILAVDFKDFPRYLAKTESYGYSLMDTGVGLFVLISGLVHKNVNKNNYRTIIKSNTKFIVILLLLGIVRYFSVKQLEYQEHITEYGVHWNFFITLAVCKFLSSVLLLISSQTLILCILVLSIHELLLFYSLQNWVFSDRQRISFIDANKEGISSSLGYVSLYLFAAHLKKIINNTSIKRQDVLNKLILFSGIVLVTSFTVNKFLPASRTLANAGYCTFISTLLTSAMTFIYLLEIFFNNTDKKICFQVPLLLKVINNNGLLYFLIANLCTGAVNLTFQTLLLPSNATFVILNIYMIFTISIVLYLDKKGIML